jgi:hypothetical protein
MLLEIPLRSSGVVGARIDGSFALDDARYRRDQLARTLK